MALSVEDIIKSYETRKEKTFSKLREQQKTDNEFYELEYTLSDKVKFPSIYSQLNPDDGREWVDAGVRTFTMDNPKCIVPPRSDNTRDSDTLIESFYNGLLQMLAGSQPNLIKVGGKYILVRGEMFWKVTVNDADFGNTYDIDSFPIKFDCPDPMFIYPSAASVIEAFPIKVEEALLMCENDEALHWDNPDRKGMDEEVIYLQYWTAAERCFLIDKIPILKGEIQPNIYGVLPYIHAYSGYGIPSPNPATLSRSILYGKRDLLRMYTAALSQMYAINSRFAWPHKEIHGSLEDLAEYEKNFGKINFSPEEITPVPTGMEIVTSGGETPPSGFYAHLSMLGQKASPPMILSTDAPDYSSGYFANVMAGAGKAVYKDPFKSLESSLEKALKLAGMMVENVIKKKVGVRSMSVANGQTSFSEVYVDPKDFKGYYDCKVSLFADTPEANAAQKKLGIELQATGVRSHRANLIEFQGLTKEEADKETSQLWAERALANNPALLQALGDNAIQRLGIAKESEAVATPTEPKAPGYLPTMKGVGEGMAGAEQVFEGEAAALDEQDLAIR